MKKYIMDFFRRGCMASGIGPIVLAVLYLILHYQGAVDTLTVEQTCMGIFSLTTLAFIAGGLNVVYQIERLPLMAAILIHGVVLYISYLVTYLLNNWIEWGTAPLLVFTVIFIVGYIVIWTVIYFVIKRNTEKLNKILKEKQQKNEECI